MTNGRDLPANGFGHDALVRIRLTWMSWYLLHREICDNVLWTPIRLRCRDGNGSTIALVFYHDLVHHYGVHLHLRR